MEMGRSERKSGQKRRSVAASYVSVCVVLLCLASLSGKPLCFACNSSCKICLYSSACKIHSEQSIAFIQAIFTLFRSKPMQKQEPYFLFRLRVCLNKIMMRGYENRTYLLDIPSYQWWLCLKRMFCIIYFPLSLSLLGHQTADWSPL